MPHLNLGVNVKQQKPNSPTKNLSGIKKALMAHPMIYLIHDMYCHPETSARSTKQAPMYLLANRGNLDSAVLRNSWFRQLFVRNTETKGVYKGAYVDIFDELQARI